MTEILPLIYFSHAELKVKENLSAKVEFVNSDRVKATKFDSSSSKRKLKLSIQDDEMNYEGFEEEEQPFLIGVLDKNTREISVCNTPYFVMKPECYLGSRSETNQASDADQTKSYSEKLNLLTAAFGSSKKRKAMQTKLKNKIDTETLETAVSAAVEESKKIFKLKARLARNLYKTKAHWSNSQFYQFQTKMLKRLMKSTIYMRYSRLPKPSLIDSHQSNLQNSQWLLQMPSKNGKI